MGNLPSAEMSGLKTPEQHITKPKTEEKVEEPRGPAEKSIIGSIAQDGDPDKILESIAGRPAVPRTEMPTPASQENRNLKTEVIAEIPAAEPKTEGKPDTAERIIDQASQQPTGEGARESHADPAGREPIRPLADVMPTMSPREAVANLVRSLTPTAVLVQGETLGGYSNAPTREHVGTSPSDTRTVLKDRAGRIVPEKPGEDKYGELVDNEKKRINATKQRPLAAVGTLIKSFGPGGIRRMLSNEDIAQSPNIVRRQNPENGIWELIDTDGSVVPEEPGEDRTAEVTQRHYASVAEKKSTRHDRTPPPQKPDEAPPPSAHPATNQGEVGNSEVPVSEITEAPATAKEKSDADILIEKNGHLSVREAYVNFLFSWTPKGMIPPNETQFVTHPDGRVKSAFRLATTVVDPRGWIRNRTMQDVVDAESGVIDRIRGGGVTEGQRRPSADLSEIRLRGAESEMPINVATPEQARVPKNPEVGDQRTFDAITPEQVDAYKKSLLERHGIDLSGVTVDITRPGDDVFDAEEIKFRYFQHADEPGFDEVRDLLEQHEANPKNVPTDRLRDIARAKGIVLEGKMPGFAAVSGENRIVFFAVQDQDAISMAQKYAEKERDTGRNFATSEEAQAYIKGLGEKALLHEFGHIVYAGRRAEDVTNWNGYVESNQQLKNRVIDLQSDKYEGMGEPIPVAEEAFADYFVDVTGEGRVVSRLDADPEAIKRVSTMIVPEQPDNTVSRPGEVAENIRRLKDALDKSQPMEVPSSYDPSKPPVKTDEYGEIQK